MPAKPKTTLMRYLFAGILLLGLALPMDGRAQSDGSGADPDYDLSLNAQVIQPGFLGKLIDVASSGAASFRVPIEVPPGRGGVAVPDLTLQYTSSGGNGWLGVGWELDLGFIERNHKYGLNYSGTDFLVNGASEMTPRAAWGSGYYGTKIEEDFTKYEFISAGQGWVAYRKSGARYYYGTTAGSRQADPANGDRVFKWCLDRIEDPNGNTLTVSYVEDQGQIYPARIDYTDANNYVVFTLEDRPDPITSYRPHFAVVTAKRLARIDTYGNGVLARQYSFDYEIGAASRRSRISQIHLPPLPPITIQWQAGSPGAFDMDRHQAVDADLGLFGSNEVAYVDTNGDARTDLITRSNHQINAYLGQADGSFSDIPVVSGSETACGCFKPGCMQAGDVNGDGWVDLVVMSPAYQHEFYVNLSYRDGRFQCAGPSNTLDIDGYGYGYDVQRFFLSDVNRDGKSDLIKFSKNSVFTHLTRDDGFGFAESAVISPIPSFGHPTHLADVNGDGLSDIVRFVMDYEGFAADSYVMTHFGRSDGSFDADGVRHTLGQHYFSKQHTMVLDANNDGLTDIITYYPDYDNNQRLIYIHLSRGDGSYSAPRQSAVILSYTLDYPDVNGDGYPDAVAIEQINGYPNEFSGGNIHVYRGQGDGSFAATPTITTYADGSNHAAYTRFVDIDGDGLVDFTARWQGMSHTYPAAGGVPDLIAAKADSYGAVTTLSYRPSSAYENFRLPYVVQTVSEVVVDDGLGTTSRIGYDYTGGYYDVTEREYRGFHQVTQTNPDNTTRQTVYFWDNILKWKPQGVETRDPDGDLLIFNRSDWRAQKTGEAHFVHKILEQEIYYDSSPQQAYWEVHFGYDAENGNLLSRRLRGGPMFEAVRVDYTYDNFDAWLWRRTAQTLSGETSGKVRESMFAYETGTGNLLFREDWLEGGDNPVTTYRYDGYGNVIEETDPRGHTTFTEYETVLNTYPSRIIAPQTDGVDHIIQITSYDYRWGKPTAQVDENGQTTTMAYDDLGRPTRTDYPDGGQEIKVYSDTAAPYFVQTRIKESAAGWIDSFAYFDGLGRPIQNVSFGENDTPIVTRQYYDAMGRNHLTRGPFFAAGSDYPQQPPADHPYSHTTQYDYRSRPLLVQSPLGGGHHADTIAEVRTGYEGFDITVTDPDGGKKTERRDFLGRVYEVLEYNGDETYRTQYGYNAAGDLETITNNLDQTKRFGYDTLGRKLTMNDPDLGYWRYTYDANGNLKTRTDAKNQTISFDYDALNRPVAKTYSTADPTVTYTYDNPAAGANGIGRAHTVANANATTTYDAYDAMGRSTSVTRTITGAPQGAYTTEYTYDPAGKLTAMVYPDGYEVTQTYHPGSGLLHTVSGPTVDDQFAELDGYRPTGKIGGIYFGNGTQCVYGYDPRSTRLVSILTQNPAAAAIIDKSYRYSPAGDMTRITDHKAGITYTYAYDALHRLVSEHNTAASETYAGIDLVFEYAAYSRPLHAPDQVVSQQTSYDYDYDNNGNMTEMADFSRPGQAAVRTVTYNADNMPLQIVHALGATVVTTELFYDGQGRRVEKTVGAVGSTYYIGAHFEVESGVEVKYIFAGNQRIAKVTTSGRHFFHKDHLGSSNVVTNYPAGTVVETTEYLPFGSDRSHSGAVVSDYKFTDQEKDQSTGLYNYDARMYDPIIALFVSADVVDPDWYDPQSLNRYAYARNNPLKYVDPSGNEVEDPYDSLSMIGEDPGAYDLEKEAPYVAADAAFWAFDIANSGVPTGEAAALGIGLRKGVQAFKGKGARKLITEGIDAAKRLFRRSAPKSGVHKNSLDYVGETHVYRVKGPEGTYKIGESAQGTRVIDGASIRAEQQARKLTRETGQPYRSDIRKTFPDKKSAREYETRLIERFRRIYGDDTLPGNKTNR